MLNPKVFDKNLWTFPTWKFLISVYFACYLQLLAASECPSIELGAAIAHFDSKFEFQLVVGNLELPSSKDQKDLSLQLVLWILRTNIFVASVFDFIFLVHRSESSVSTKLDEQCSFH